MTAFNFMTRYLHSAAPRPLPELLSRERFVRIASHAGFATEIVADRYAVMVVEVDQMDYVRARHGAATADYCATVVTRRFQETLPSDALGTQLREDAYGMLAFGADTEAGVLALAERVHQYMRTPVATPAGEMVLSVSVGIAFTRSGVKAVDALRAAERAVLRVRQNGGDATFIGRVIPFVTPPTSAAAIDPDELKAAS
jgi:GGDEF domain-containing protein